MVSEEIRLAPKGGGVGWLRALAQGLGTNAPAGVTALYFVGIAGLVGADMPLIVALAFLIYLGMTLIVYEWSKIVASSYSWVAIQKKGYNSSFMAFTGGWTYFFYYFIPVFAFAMIGEATFASLLSPSIAVSYPWLWIPIVILLTAEAGIFVWFGIKPNLTYVLVTGISEVVFLTITSLVIIFKSGGLNTTEVFTLAPVHGNVTAIFIALVLSITTFGGLNSVIPVAEETKDPKKNIPKSLLWLALILGVPLILSAYAQTIAFGVGNMGTYAGLPDPGILIYEKVLGVGAAMVLAFFVVNSFNSALITDVNSSIRMTFGFSRDGVIFPKVFSELNKYGQPGKSGLITAIVNGVFAIVTGIILGPLVAGLFMIIWFSFYSYLNHGMAGIGLMLYHSRNKSLKVVRHVIIPLVVVAVLFAAAFYSVYPTLPGEPYTLAPVFAFLWVLAGWIIYFYLKKKNPEKMAKFGDTTL